MKIITAKLKGKEPTLTDTVEPCQAEVVDFMARLRQSLQGSGTGRAAKRLKPATKREKPAARAARHGASTSTARGTTKRTRAA